MKFRTTIELRGETATGLQGPAAVVQALGPGKRPRMHVTIAAHAYRGTVAVYDGAFTLPLGAPW